MATCTKIIDHRVCWVCVRSYGIVLVLVLVTMPIHCGSLDFLSQITHPLPFWDRISFPYHKNTSFRRIDEWLGFSFSLSASWYSRQRINRICFDLSWILHFSSNFTGRSDYFTIRYAMLKSHTHTHSLINMELFSFVSKWIACVSIFFFKNHAPIQCVDGKKFQVFRFVAVVELMLVFSGFSLIFVGHKQAELV